MKDGKIYSIRGYPVRLDTNGADFTQLVKQMEAGLGFNKKSKIGSGQVQVLWKPGPNQTQLHI